MRKTLSALVTVLVITPAAHAEKFTLHYTATINSIGLINGYNSPEQSASAATFLDQQVSIGDTLSGEYSFDTSIAPSSQSSYGSVARALYGHGPAFTSFVQFDKSGFREKAAEGSTIVDVSDSSNAQYQSDEVVFNGNAYGRDWTSTRLVLSDPTAAALEGPAMPGAELSQLQPNYFQYFYSTYVPGIPSVRLLGEITSLSLVSAVPEPGTYAMLLSGLGLLAWRRKRA